MILSPEMTLLGGRNMHFLPVTFSLVGERVNHHHPYKLSIHPIIIIILLLIIIIIIIITKLLFMGG